MSTTTLVNDGSNGEVLGDSIYTKKGYESIQLLDEIEDLVSSSSKVILSSKVLVDAEALYHLMERFEDTFPSELKQADMVINRVQSIVDDAEVKAELIIDKANKEAQYILNNSRILAQAQEQANCIVTQATAVKNSMAMEAESYVSSLFEEAERIMGANAMALGEARASILRGE